MQLSAIFTRYSTGNHSQERRCTCGTDRLLRKGVCVHNKGKGVEYQVGEDQETVESVREIFLRSPRKSTSRANQKLQSPQPTVWKILRRRLFDTVKIVASCWLSCEIFSGMLSLTAFHSTIAHTAAFLDHCNNPLLLFLCYGCHLVTKKQINDDRRNLRIYGKH